MNLRTVVPTANGGDWHKVRDFVEEFRLKPFIYGLVDPQEPEHIRYVGLASRSRRPFEHAWQSKRKTRCYASHWVSKLQREGRSYNVVVLETLGESCTWDFLGFVESRYIASLQELGHRLTNTRLGGEGNLLGNRSERTLEHRKKLRETSYWNGPEREARIALAKARWTPEIRAAQSAKLIGRHLSDEAYENHLRATRAPEAITRKSQTAKRIKCSKCGQFGQHPEGCPPSRRTSLPCAIGCTCRRHRR